MRIYIMTANNEKCEWIATERRDQINCCEGAPVKAMGTWPLGMTDAKARVPQFQPAPATNQVGS